MPRIVKFFTGRFYGQKQILEITVPDQPLEERHSIGTFEVTFDDKARSIRGTCRVAMFTDMHNDDQDIGRAVLHCYDTMQYREI